MSNQDIDKRVIIGSPLCRWRDQDAGFLIVFICGGEEVFFFPHFVELLFYLRRVKIVIHSIDSLYKDCRNNLGSRCQCY